MPVPPIPVGWLPGPRDRSVWRVALLMIALAVAAPLAAPLAAQPERPRSSSEPGVGTLSLRVISESDAPVPFADVSLRQGSRTQQLRTDSSGSVQVTGLSVGPWTLSVRRIGYAAAEARVDLLPGLNPVTLELHAASQSASTTAPTELDAMTVRADAMPSTGRLREFDLRVKRGTASAVVTRTQIERRNPTELTQILRGIAGLRLADSLGNMVAISTRGQKASRGATGLGLVPCVMRLAVDGVVFPALTNLNAVRPVDVYGVEVFYGPSRTPAQFDGLRTDNFCGMIMIWTRDQ